jgi:ankyrin repeat protein
MARREPLDLAPLDLSKAEDRGKLYEAIDLGDAEQFKAWLDAGLDPNWEAGGQTLLMAATSNWRRLGCARLLLERGADPNKGHPPTLQRYLCEEALLLLLEAGADPRLKWAPEGEKPRLMEEWWAREGKKDGDAHSYQHRIKMLRFWRRKRLGAKRAPECTKALAMSLPRRAHAITSSLFEDVRPLDPAKEAKLMAIDAWIDRNFNAVDFLEPVQESDGSWSWALWTQRDGAEQLNRSVPIFFKMGDEHPTATLKALAAQTERL